MRAHTDTLWKLLITIIVTLTLAEAVEIHDHLQYAGQHHRHIPEWAVKGYRLGILALVFFAVSFSTYIAIEKRR